MDTVRFVLLLCLALPGCRKPLPPRAPFAQAMREAWPAARGWQDADEAGFAAFVARLGDGVATRRCHHLDECLRDPAVNPLYDARYDAGLRLHVDCADLPYAVRAYYAFRQHLPFVFVSAVGSDEGGDVRYGHHLRPREERRWTEFLTPADLFAALPGAVHSGTYRTAPEVEGDFYPVAVRRGSVRPGSVFYDPHGHVLLVVGVRDDGLVHLIDAHPDESLTYRRFDTAFTPGPAHLGGGFKNFRPLRPAPGDPAGFTRAPAAALPDLDGVSGWDPAAWVTPDGRQATYAAWVRAALALPGTGVDPEQELREQIGGVCRAIEERAAAVALAVAAGLPRRPHPPTLPENIYGADGEWEVYASPSRDARLKAQVRELSRLLASSRQAMSAAAQVAIWQDEAARPACQVRYTGSTGAVWTLGLPDVLDRLFSLSFDPYHCPELRWGAPPGSSERGACPDDPQKARLYLDEARLRHRIDRVYGVPTPLSAGPATPEDIDPRRILGLR